jgi:DNA adenine methylase
MLRDSTVAIRPLKAVSRSGMRGRANACDISMQLPLFETAQAPNSQPFLRWAGGKTRLMPELLPHLPLKFADYYEPFLGGGAVFFAVCGRATGRCYLSDLNTELVNCWRSIQHDPANILEALGQYQGYDREEDYYAVRSTSPTDPIKRAARFLFLNQTSWNGLWRVNKFGVFNVPWGAKAFRGWSLDRLLAISQGLQDVTITEEDFRRSLLRPKKGDFVYLDPPYLPISDTSKFSGYTERRFRAADLAELAALCQSLSARGVQWVLSNRDNQLVRDLFEHAKIVSLKTRRSVAAQNRRDVEPADSPEVIVIGQSRR